MSLIIKLSVFALGAAVLTVVLRQEKKEFALLAEIGCCAALLAAALTVGREVIGSLQNLAEQSALSDADLSVLLKGAGVCVVTELCASLCRESGNAAVGEALVFSGRLMTLLLALPLMERVIQLAVAFCNG